MADMWKQIQTIFIIYKPRTVDLFHVDTQTDERTEGHKYVKILFPNSFLNFNV